MATFLAGAAAIDQLKPTSKVLIAEACTHAPLSEDIGREKIPQLLRKKIGESLTIEVVSGTDFPENLTTYDLIIHCGACMFNRKYVLRRLEYAKSQGVPICNYGIALAHLSGILEYVSF
jgi:predicted GTPase